MTFYCFKFLTTHLFVYLFIHFNVFHLFLTTKLIDVFHPCTYFNPLRPLLTTIYCVFTGILPLIIVCLKEQSNNLKLHGLLVLDEIAKHNEDLAQRIVESSALPHVICFLSPKFTEVKIQVN